MPSLVVTMFVNEIQLNTWYDALEICYYWITPTQYLPDNVLRGIVEIMLVCLLYYIFISIKKKLKMNIAGFNDFLLLKLLSS